MDDRANTQKRSAPLNGWRGIAIYLGRNQSTVKRWATTRDLPVHRPHGGEARKGVPVYAFADELDAWIRGHPDEHKTAEDEAGKVPPADANDSAAGNGGSPSRRHLVTALLAAGLVASGGGMLGWRYAQESSRADVLERVDDQARALHTRATYLWQKRAPETLPQAVDLLKRALEIEPRFAAAQTDLAIVYNLMVEYGVTDAEDGYALSRAAAERAISLDPRNARAHSVLGDILFFWDRDYEEGLNVLWQGAKLDPMDATARHWLASSLMARGRYDDAAAEIAAARELEPLSRSIIVSQAMIELGRQKPDSARQLLAPLIRNEPGYRSPYRFLAFAEMAIGNDRAYLAALERRFLLTDDLAGLRVVAAGQLGLRNGGAEGMAQAMIAAARADLAALKDPYFVAHWLALANAWPEAVEQLARTPTRHFAYYGIDPAFAEARKDAAFRDRIVSAGLPEI